MISYDYMKLCVFLFTVCIGFLSKFVNGLLDEGKDPLTLGKSGIEKELTKACKKAQDKDERFVSALLLSAKKTQCHCLRPPKSA